MKVLVCGGREFEDRRLVYSILGGIHASSPITEIIAGGATGADTLAENWADERKIHKRIFPADWEKYGRAAGPIRNREMYDATQPDLVVAFPGGRGTANMLAYAISKGCSTRSIALASQGSPNAIGKQAGLID